MYIYILYIYNKAILNLPFINPDIYFLIFILKLKVCAKKK